MAQNRPRIFEGPSDKTALIGESIDLSCIIEWPEKQSAYRYSSYEFQWYRNTTLLSTGYKISNIYASRFSLISNLTDSADENPWQDSSSDNISINSGNDDRQATATPFSNSRFTNYSLHIRNVTRSDSTEFRCSIRSAAGVVERKSALVDVMKPPNELTIYAYVNDEPQLKPQLQSAQIQDQSQSDFNPDISSQAQVSV